MKSGVYSIEKYSNFINTYPNMINNDSLFFLYSISEVEASNYIKTKLYKNKEILQLMLFHKKILPAIDLFFENEDMYNVILNINKVAVFVAIIELMCASYIHLKKYSELLIKTIGYKNFLQLKFLYLSYNSSISSRYIEFTEGNFISNIRSYGVTILHSITYTTPFHELIKMVLPKTEHKLPHRLSMHDLIKINKFIYD